MLRTGWGRVVAFALVAAFALVTTPAHAAPEADSQAPEEFVALRDVDPTILEEVRYAGPHNFVGERVPGYREPICLLTRRTAEALHEAQKTLLARGYGLKVYDCFRPQRAVDHYAAWSKNPGDRRMKGEFYPDVAKSALFDEGYIDERSGHSRGSTVDLTAVKLPALPQRPFVPGEPLAPCTAPKGERFPDNGLDMGTGFDCFDPLAHTDDPRVSQQARKNRDFLRQTLESVGMQNYPGEWWHFTLTAEPFPETYFDFPVSRRSLAD